MLILALAGMEILGVAMREAVECLVEDVLRRQQNVVCEYSMGGNI
jgi:hypothetical protein